MRFAVITGTPGGDDRGEELHGLVLVAFAQDDPLGLLGRVGAVDDQDEGCTVGAARAEPRVVGLGEDVAVAPRARTGGGQDDDRRGPAGREVPTGGQGLVGQERVERCVHAAVLRASGWWNAVRMIARCSSVRGGAASTIASMRAQ